MTTGPNADPGPRADHFDPRRPVAAELELSVTDGFELIAVGDCILSRPMSQHRATQPGFAAVLDLFAGAHAVYGNLETVLVDHDGFAGAPHAWQGDWPLSAEPSVAADLRVMGLDVLSRANNHALDWGVEGMRETTRLLDGQGLTHAGTGERRALARRARFRETSHGRVGIVSCTTTFRETSDALDPDGAAAGRPGVSSLSLRRSTGVPEAMLARIARLREELAAAGLDDLLRGFERGDGEPHHCYAMDRPQLAAILREVRQGKQFADFLLVALHAHESLTSPDEGRADWTPPLPAAWVAEFGRLAIDAGADAVVVTGIHHLGPIELHAGRPILTGLGNFFWSDIQTPLSADLRAGAADALCQAFERPERATDADLTLLLNMPAFAHDEFFLSVAAKMVFDRAGLHRLVLYPIDLGYGEPLALSGLPRLASVAQGERIFTRLSRISAAHGTTIEVRRDDALNTVVGEVGV